MAGRGGADPRLASAARSAGGAAVAAWAPCHHRRDRPRRVHAVWGKDPRAAGGSGGVRNGVRSGSSCSAYASAHSSQSASSVATGVSPPRARAAWQKARISAACRQARVCPVRTLARCCSTCCSRARATAAYQRRRCSASQFLFPLPEFGFRREAFEILQEVSQPRLQRPPRTVAVEVRMLIPVPGRCTESKASDELLVVLGHAGPRAVLLPAELLRGRLAGPWPSAR